MNQKEKKEKITPIIRTKSGLEPCPDLTGTIRIYALKPSVLQMFEAELKQEEQQGELKTDLLLTIEDVKYDNNKNNKALLNKISYIISNISLGFYHMLYYTMFRAANTENNTTWMHCDRILLYSNINSTIFSIVYVVKADPVFLEKMKAETCSALYFLNLSSGADETRPFFIAFNSNEDPCRLIDSSHSKLQPISDYNKNFTAKTINKFLKKKEVESDLIDNNPQVLTTILTQAFRENANWHNIQEKGFKPLTKQTKPRKKK